MSFLGDAGTSGRQDPGTSRYKGSCRYSYDAAREKAKAYDQAAWEAKINEVYGASASSIIALEHESQKNEVNGRLKRIDAIEAHWDEIVKLMDDNMPTAARMIEILKSLDAPYLPSQIGFDDDRLYNAMLYAKETRARYTMLSMMADLGVTEDLAK